MIMLILVLLGLCFGSFVNALVWRLHEQGIDDVSQISDLSILKGRSMCPACHHTLSTSDLIPVLSWLSLRGKCRYCQAPISWQYPVVELVAAGLFITSYLFWPSSIQTPVSIIYFGLWLVSLTSLLALIVYDLRWQLLPNRIVLFLASVAVVELILKLLHHGGFSELLVAFWGIIIGGGLFYILFQVSDGKWIGGGDVKLGAVLGLIIGGPANSFLMLFLASLLGTLVSVPLLINNKLNRRSHVPFGPFLIIAAIVIKLFGASVLTWYKQKLLY